MKFCKLKVGVIATMLAILPFVAQAQQFITGGATGGVSGASIVGTGGTTETLPTTSDTLAGLGTAQTFTAANTFSGTTTLSSAGAITENGTLTIASGQTANTVGTLQISTAGVLTELGAMSFGSSSTIATQGIPFSNSLGGNSPLLTTMASFTSTQALAGINVLNSAAGRTIFPSGGLTVMVSGTAGGATSMSLECQPSGNIIATWPIVDLVNNVPIGTGLYTSAGAATTIVLGKALTAGCQAADSVLLSTTGTLTTTSQIFVNLPYTVK